MFQEVIEAGANEGVLSSALCVELAHNQCSDEILEILFTRGNANPNFENGKPLSLAAVHSSDTALRLFASSTRTTRPSRRNAIVALLRSQLLEGVKAARVTILIDVRDCETVVLSGLKAQVESCLSAHTHGRQWPMDCFRVLLGTEPNLELDAGEGITTVITAAAIPLLKLILRAELSQTTIKKALMHALTVNDQYDRLEICQAILPIVTLADTFSSALARAANKGQCDVCEELLGSGAQIDFDEHTSIRCAVSRPDLELLHILIKASAAAIVASSCFRRVKSTASRWDPARNHECDT